MADLEKMAIKRDRGYLVRLVVGLVLGVAASIFIYAGLTGSTVSTCAANAIVGEQPSPDE